MGDVVGRAIAVGLSRRWSEALRTALSELGYTLAGEAADGPAGLRLTRETQPALIVAGAVMPGMDGVAFVQRARTLRLNRQPAVVLLRPPGLRLPGEAQLASLGAGVADAPPSAGRLRDALDPLAEWFRALPPEKAARLEALLDALGVPRHPGRECLTLAVTLVWHDRRRVQALKDGVYPELAQRTGLSPAQAERAISHVIERAWRTGEIEQQHRIFGDTIDARRGKPTCGEMIAQLAEELRWEG